MNNDIQSIGAMLQQARETRGLSFEEVEAETRIRVKFLQALESGDLSLLPSTAHAKGFLRNYAQYLRLDADEIVSRFISLIGGSAPRPTTTTTGPVFTPPQSQGPSLEPAFDQQDSPSAAAEPPPPFVPYPSTQPPTQQRARSSYVTPDRRVGPGAPAGVGRHPTPARPMPAPYLPSGTGPLSGPQVTQQERPDTPVRRLFQNNLFIGAILAVGIIGIVIWVVGQLSSVSGQALNPSGQATEILVEGSPAAAIPLITIQPTLDSTGTASASLPSFIAGDRVALSINVTERTWARVIVDGETQLEGQVVGGTILQYQGQEIVILVGNAIAFDVTFNGQPLGPIGDRGQVVERTFTPSGQITPTPTPTVTPTNTSVPTATQRGVQTPTPTRRP